MEVYNLHEDPFTKFPLTSKEYAENNREYNKQLMEAKFGYWEEDWV